MPPSDPGSAAALLGSLELAVLRALWIDAPATVRTVLEHVNGGRDDDLAYTSVMTVLDRLHDKGLVTRGRSGRAYRYEPAHADEAALVDHIGRQQVASLVDRLGDVALVHFAATLDDLDPGTREQLRSLARRED
jgi:predicted transcriptional regulator